MPLLVHERDAARALRAWLHEHAGRVNHRRQDFEKSSWALFETLVEELLGVARRERHTESAEREDARADGVDLIDVATRSLASDSERGFPKSLRAEARGAGAGGAPAAVLCPHAPPDPRPALRRPCGRILGHVLGAQDVEDHSASSVAALKHFDHVVCMSRTRETGM